MTGVAGAGCLTTSVDSDGDATDANEFPEPTYGDLDREYRVSARWIWSLITPVDGCSTAITCIKTGMIRVLTYE